MIKVQIDDIIFYSDNIVIDNDVDVKFNTALDKYFKMSNLYKTLPKTCNIKLNNKSYIGFVELSIFETDNNVTNYGRVKSYAKNYHGIFNIKLTGGIETKKFKRKLVL
jgi:hypothetical protein